MIQIGVLGDVGYTDSVEFGNIMSYFIGDIDKYTLVTGTKSGTEELCRNWADSNGKRLHIISSTNLTEDQRTIKIGKIITKAIIFWDGKDLNTDRLRMDLFHLGIPTDVFYIHPDGGNT